MKPKACFTVGAAEAQGRDMPGTERQGRGVEWVSRACPGSTGSLWVCAVTSTVHRGLLPCSVPTELWDTSHRSVRVGSVPV